MVFHILLDDSNLCMGENMPAIIFKTCENLSELVEELNKLYYQKSLRKTALM